MRNTLCGAIGTAALFAAVPAMADDSKTAYLLDASLSDADAMAYIPDAASVPYPDLAFEPTPEITDTYDKYFYFHREDVSFEDALADIRDCDSLARGLNSGMGYQQTYSPYGGLAGVAGGAIGNAMVSAIFGSAEKRRIRRVNLRRCMDFKGYERYGLEKDLWQEFNFEEGFSGEDEYVRQSAIIQQALVASGPKPTTEGLGR